MRIQIPSHGLLTEHMKNLETLNQRIDEVLRNQPRDLYKIQASIAQSIQSQAFQGALRDLEAIQGRANTQLQKFAPAIERATEFVAAIQKQITPAFESLRWSFERLPPATKRALTTLAEHGWFLDPDLPITALWEIEKALTEGRTDDIEAALVKHYQDKLNEIEDAVLRRFPKRERFTRSAFQAHRRNDYAASIPLMLAQTDGMCKDITDACFFVKVRRRPGTAAYVERLAADTFRAALLTPLSLALPISASERYREPAFDGLNRHTVLHGESLDYDTPTNAAKAVSLIHYVAHVLSIDTDT